MVLLILHVERHFMGLNRFWTFNSQIVKVTHSTLIRFVLSLASSLEKNLFSVHVQVSTFERNNNIRIIKLLIMILKEELLIWVHNSAMS